MTAPPPKGYPLGGRGGNLFPWYLARLGIKPRKPSRVSRETAAWKEAQAAHERKARALWKEDIEPFGKIRNIHLFTCSLDERICQTWRATTVRSAKRRKRFAFMLSSVCSRNTNELCSTWLTTSTGRSAY